MQRAEERLIICTRRPQPARHDAPKRGCNVVFRRWRVAAQGIVGHLHIFPTTQRRHAAVPGECHEMTTVRRHPRPREQTTQQGRALKLSENPAVRLLVVIVLVAAGIRLTVELLEPVWPYLLAVFGGFAVGRIVGWWRNRW